MGTFVHLSSYVRTRGRVKVLALFFFVYANTITRPPRSVGGGRSVMRIAKMSSTTTWYRLRAAGAQVYLNCVLTSERASEQEICI